MPTTCPPVALVSALVTLDPATPGTTRRSIGEYLRLAGPLLDLDVPLVVYVDDDAVAEWLLVERERRMPDTPTVVRPATWPPGTEHDRSLLSQHLGEHRPACARSASKDSADYLLVGWTKPWWLRRAADEVDAARYRWIDLGLHHTAPFSDGLGSMLRRDPGRRHPASVHLMTRIRGDAPPTWFERRAFDLALRSAADQDPNWWWDAVPLVAGGTFDVAHDALG